MNQSQSNVGVIAIVSRQTVPILQFLWHLQQTAPELTQVILLHTSDPGESAGPALRVSQLWRESFPTISCKTQEVGILPQEVRRSIREIQSAHSDVGRWIVSSTGGLKLMTLGVGDVIDERTDVQYVEIKLGWHRVTRNEEGFFGERLERQPAPGVADAIPVERLVATQLGRFDHLPKPIPLEALTRDLSGLTQDLIDTGWNWRPVFERLGDEWSDRRNGTGFELYIAACLKAMGIDNLAWSLVTQLKKDRVQENDVVVWRGGRLVVLDLKLDRRWVKSQKEGIDGTEMVEVSFSQQVLLANQMRKDLGGLGAEWILLRPTLTLDKRDQDLLEAFGLNRWADRAGARGLLGKLSEWLGGRDLPEVRALIEASDKPFVARYPA